MTPSAISPSRPRGRTIVLLILLILPGVLYLLLRQPSAALTPPATPVADAPPRAAAPLPSPRSRETAREPRAPADPARAYLDARPPADTAVATLVKLRRDERVRPLYEMVDRAGMLTGQAIDDAALTPQEITQVQAAYIVFQQSIRDLLAAKVTPAPDLATKPGSVAYRIPAYAAEGEQAFSALLDELTTHLGPQRTWQLAKSLPVENLAARFGAYESTVVFGPPYSSAEPANRLMTITVLEPGTGRSLSKTSGSSSQVDAGFFNFFQSLPPAP